MNTRYLAAITDNPKAGKGMVIILIIDNESENGDDELLRVTVSRDEKPGILQKYTSLYGDDLAIMDVSSRS